jgi:hypothetical protein
MEDLNEAVQLDPSRQAIRYNRARVVLFRCSTKPALPISQQTLDDIDRAIQLGPTTCQLYSDAAQLYALAAREDLRRSVVARAAPPSFVGMPLVTTLQVRGQQRIESCLSHISEAIAGGCPTIQLAHPHLRFLRSHFTFPTQLPAHPQPAAPAINLGLIEPVELPD